MKTAREMFEELNYEQKIIDNKNNNCEDVILYTNKNQEFLVQFNLFSELVCFQIKNKFKDYDKINMFITKELLRAIDKQVEELNWKNE